MKIYLIQSAAIISGLILFGSNTALAQRPGGVYPQDPAPAPSVDTDRLIDDEVESNQVYKYDAKIGEEDRVLARGTYTVTRQEVRAAGGMSKGLSYGSYYYWDEDSNRWALDDGWHLQKSEVQPRYPLPEDADADAFPPPNDAVVRYEEPVEDDVSVFEGAFETEDVAYFDAPNDGRLYVPLNVTGGHDVIIDLGQKESLADVGIELGTPVVVRGERRSVNGATVIRAQKIQKMR